METTQQAPLTAITVVAVVAAAGSVFLPVLGTVFAAIVVWVASRSATDERNESVVRLAALATAGVALLHVLFFSLVMPASFGVG